MAAYTPSTLPEPQVWMAFAKDWQDQTEHQPPVSTDFANVTDDVLDLTITWGRQSWMDDARAGTLTLRMTDDAREYEPEYASGARYPNIVPGVPVIIWDNNGDEGWWFGWVDYWYNRYEPEWDGGQTLVQVGAVDALGWLAGLRTSTAIASGDAYDQINDLLDDVGWRSGTDGRLIDTKFNIQNTLQAYTPDNESALSVLQLICRSVGAYCAAVPSYTSSDWSSAVKVENRYNPQPTETVLATFNDDESAHDYKRFGTMYARQNLINRAEVTRVGGTTQVSTDGTSRGLYGTQDVALSGLLLASDGECQDYADFMVQRNKDPERWGEQLDWQIAVGINYGSSQFTPVRFNERARVSRRPLGGTVFTKDYTIQGGTLNWQPGGPIDVTWFLSPFEWQEWWELGDSQLGTETRLGW